MLRLQEWLPSRSAGDPAELETVIMNSRRVLTAALGRQVNRSAIILAWIAVIGSATIDSIGAAPIVDQLLIADATSAEEHQPTESDAAEAATTDESESNVDAAGLGRVFHGAEAAVVTTLSESEQPRPLPEQANKTNVVVLEPVDAHRAMDSIEVLDECFVPDICIDRYLWALYERAPKQDSISVHERRRVAVRKKGRLVTVTKTFTRLADEDFSWKDPKAAEGARMPMVNYVIGGMDRSFKLKLFHMLHAAEEAGLSPGITSAFRDDYRQSIASGLKAANNRSYHGGSLRGGYGHGLAADIVSVKGATRVQRLAATETLWRWTDAHGKDFGIGRPYLDRDPPHVGPIDGKEYADHHPAMKARKVNSAANGKPGKTRLGHVPAVSAGAKSIHRADGSSHERRPDRSHT
jgi:D-alanyl-D-alanine carboxypeptidase